jgi:hypothetical protein
VTVLVVVAAATLAVDATSKQVVTADLIEPHRAGGYTVEQCAARFRARALGWR